MGPIRPLKGIQTLESNKRKTSVMHVLDLSMVRYVDDLQEINRPMIHQRHRNRNCKVGYWDSLNIFCCITGQAKQILRRQCNLICRLLWRGEWQRWAKWKIFWSREYECQRAHGKAINAGKLCDLIVDSLFLCPHLLSLQIYTTRPTNWGMQFNIQMVAYWRSW